MTLIFGRKFSKDLDRLTIAPVRKELLQLITVMESASGISDIPNTKNSKGQRIATEPGLVITVLGSFTKRKQLY